MHLMAIVSLLLFIYMIWIIGLFSYLYINKISFLPKPILWNKTFIKIISHYKLKNNSQTSSPDSYMHNCCHKNSCNSYTSFVLMRQHTFSTLSVLELNGQLLAYNPNSFAAALFYCKERTIGLSLCIIMEIKW